MTGSFTLGTVHRDVPAVAVSVALVVVSPAIQLASIAVLDGVGVDSGLPDASFVLGPAAIVAAAVIVVCQGRYDRTRVVAYGLATFVSSAALLASLYASLPVYRL